MNCEQMIRYDIHKISLQGLRMRNETIYRFDVAQNRIFKLSVYTQTLSKMKYETWCNSDLLNLKCYDIDFNIIERKFNLYDL